MSLGLAKPGVDNEWQSFAREGYVNIRTLTDILNQDRGSLSQFMMIDAIACVISSQFARTREQFHLSHPAFLLS